MDELRIMMDVSNYVDIFGVCETFLNKSIDDSTVHVDGYNFERKDRQENPLWVDSKGGGVLICLADHINYSRRQDIESQDIESNWIEIKLRNSKSFLICSVYRPPSSKADWCDTVSKQIETALSIRNEIYVMGGINFDFKNGDLCI